MRKLLLLLALSCLVTRGAPFELYEYLKCQLCEVKAPSGAIDDCCCDVETVDQANARHFLPILHELTKRTYFRYFAVDLWRQCPFWPDDGMCHMRDCAVCECDPAEIPACWREEEEQAAREEHARPPVAAVDPSDVSPALEPDTAKVAALSRVDFAAGAAGKGSGGSTPAPALAPWGVAGPSAGGAGTGGASFDEANVWSVQDGSGSGGGSGGAPTEGEGEGEGDGWSASNPNLQYVNLLRNPEGYTGYAGPNAWRIWSSIYSENCFTGPVEGMCLEERVFYRMISGLQTSINTHIAMTYGRGEGSRDDLYSGGTGGAAGGPSADTLLGGVHASVLGWLAGHARSALRWAEAAAGYAPLAVPEAYHPGWVTAEDGSLSPAAGMTGEAEAAARSATAALPVPVAALVLTPGLEPNVAMYVDRIARYPERLKNLYFAFLFVLRAVAKARPLLESMTFDTGAPGDDAATRALVARLLDVEIPAVLRGFDESALFRAPEPVPSASPLPPSTEAAALATAKAELAEFEAATGLGAAPTAPSGEAAGAGSGAGTGTCPPVLHGLGDLHDLSHRTAEAALERRAVIMASFRDKYRNISRIMDCVGCEKCRLWGKLQFLGMGTALKVLFADADATVAPARGSGPGELSVHLSRNEVVALINVLHRLSMSVSAIHVMGDLEARAKIGALVAQGVGGAVAVLVAVGLGVRLSACTRGGKAASSDARGRYADVSGSAAEGASLAPASDATGSSALELESTSGSGSEGASSGGARRRAAAARKQA